MAVRQMSPQETSQWCSSLSANGVKGQILRDLQDRILRMNIDGCSFDRMLKSNTLMELGVDELNPRMALSIRRTWNADFANVTFVDCSQGGAAHSAPAGGGGAAAGQRVQAAPPPGQRGSVRGQPPPMQDFQQPQAQPGGPWSSASTGTPGGGQWQGHGFPQGSPSGRHPSQPGHYGGRQHFEDPAAQHPMGDPRGLRQPSPCAASGRGGGPQPQWQRGATPADFAQHGRGGPADAGDPRGRPGPGGGFRGEAGEDPWMDQQPGWQPGGFRQGAGDDARAAASQQYGRPGAGGFPDDEWAPVPPQGRDGGPWRDDVPPRGPPRGGGWPDAGGHQGDPRGYMDYPDGGHQPGRGGYGFEDPGAFGGHPGSEAGGYFAEEGPPRGATPPGRGPPRERTPPGHPAQHGGYQGHQQPGRSPDPVQRRAQGGPARAQRAGPAGGADGWEDQPGSLEDAFAPRPKAQNTYAPDPGRYTGAQPSQPSRRGPQPSMDEWGGGLGDVVAPRQHVRNAAQPYAEQARRREAAEAAAAPPDRPPYPEGDFDDPGPPQPGGGWRPQQMPPGAGGSPWDAGEPPPRRPGAGADANDGWGGQSFGDALAAPGRPSAVAGSGRAGGPDAGGGATPGRGGGDWSGRCPPDSEAPEGLPARDAPTPPPRGRRPKAGPPDDGGFGGQSLGDCFKKAPPPPAPGGGAAASGGGASRRPAQAAPPQGSGPGADEIIKWLRSLPLSHVPEKAQNELCAVVEEGNMGGHEFDGYVQQVPPEICAPRHAMKLKAAWANKMKEAACAEVALNNLKHNENAGKGVALKI